MVAETRARLEATGAGEDQPPRRLPVPERAARRSTQKASLPGLDLEGELECSHALVDSAVAMYEEDTVRHLALDECTRRSQELGGIKKDKELKTDARGFVREQTKADHPSADLASDLRIRNAFDRRGLALEQANVMSYSPHAVLVKVLFTEYLREPPVGYAKVSLDQIVRADKEVFRRLQDWVEERDYQKP